MLSLKVFMVSLCLVVVASREVEITVSKNIKICKGINGPLTHDYPCSCWCHFGWLICPKCSTTTTTTASSTVETSTEYCTGKDDHVIRPSDPCPCECLGGYMICPTCIITTPTTEQPSTNVAHIESRGHNKQRKSHINKI